MVACSWKWMPAYSQTPFSWREIWFQWAHPCPLLFRQQPSGLYQNLRHGSIFNFQLKIPFHEKVSRTRHNTIANLFSPLSSPNSLQHIRLERPKGWKFNHCWTLSRVSMGWKIPLTRIEKANMTSPSITCCIHLDTLWAPSKPFQRTFSAI